VVVTNKFTFATGQHFDGHAEELKRYMWHRPMQHVQVAAIGQLLAPNRSGGRQGNKKQNKDVKCTHFAIRWGTILSTLPGGRGSWLS